MQSQNGEREHGTLKRASTLLPCLWPTPVCRVSGDGDEEGGTCQVLTSLEIVRRGL